MVEIFSAQQLFAAFPESVTGPSDKCQRCGRRCFGRADRAIAFAACIGNSRYLFVCPYFLIGGPRSCVGALCLLPLAPPSQLRAPLRRQANQRFALVQPPCGRTYGHATSPTASPDQFERQEEPPGVVTPYERARDEVACHR